MNEREQYLQWLRAAYEEYKVSQPPKEFGGKFKAARTYKWLVKFRQEIDRVEHFINLERKVLGHQILISV